MNDCIDCNTRGFTRRLSKYYKRPNIEKIYEDRQGTFYYHCLEDSMEESDQSTASQLNKAKRHTSTRTITSAAGTNSNVVFFNVSFVIGAVVSALLLVLTVLVLLLGEWVMTELAETLGFFSLIIGAYFSSAVVYNLWSSKWRQEIVLDTDNVLKLSGIYLAGALLTNFFSLFLPHLLVDATSFVLLSGWLLVAHSLLLQKKYPLTVFVQSPENYILVGIIMLQRIVHRIAFSAFLPASLLPFMMHSSHLFALTVVLVQQGVAMSSARKVSGAGSHMSHAGGRRESVTRLSVPFKYGVRRWSRTGSEKRSSKSSYGSLFSTGQQSNVSADSLTEARGLLNDVLLQSESVLDKNLLQKLQHLQNLVGPIIGANEPVVTRVRGSLSDEETSLLEIHNERFHIHRDSAIFSLGTTSTGMPVIPDEPLDRQRAPLRNDFPRPHLRDEHAHKPSEHRPSISVKASIFPPHSPASSHLKHGPESPLSRSMSAMDANKTFKSVSVQRKYSAEMVKRSPLEKKKTSDESPLALSKEQMYEFEDHNTSAKAVGPESHFSPSKDEQGREEKVEQIVATENEPEEEDDEHIDSVIKAMRRVSMASGQSSLSLGRVSSSGLKKNSSNFSVFQTYKQPDLNYDIEEYSECKIELMQELCSWDFPIFKFTEEANGNVLSLIAYQVFMEMGLMETFHIPPRPLINFFRALELNYGQGPYHNARHAADVLHATFYLLTEPIPEFAHQYVDSGSRVRTDAYRRKGSTLAGSMSSAFSVLELFATLLAAACHDYDHPGRTNAFLTATNNPLAVLYNDRSVLENHHAAASWEILTSDSNFNFINDLQPAEYKRLRFIFIEAILATDLKFHFSLVSEFRSKYTPGNGTIEWKCEEDRLSVLKMLIKMADINGSAKSIELHKLWTECITEEFFQQDEEERRLGLPHTMFLQRSEAEQLPKVQISFIQNLVSPLFQVCAQGGVIPGELKFVVQEQDNESDSEAKPRRKYDTDNVHSSSDEDAMYTSDPDPEEIRLVRKFTSIILDNLQSNIEMWKVELEKVQKISLVEAPPDPPPVIHIANEDGDIEDNEDEG